MGEDFLRRGGGRAGEVAVRTEEGSKGVEGPQDCAYLVVSGKEWGICKDGGIRTRQWLLVRSLFCMVLRNSC